MNRVFLTGIVASAPRTVSQEGKTDHVRMTLTVTHNTAAGIVKHELYPISAWRGIAQRMVSLVKAGMLVRIVGYLSQRLTEDGILIEVTAQEFQVINKKKESRPMPHYAAIKESFLESNPEDKQTTDEMS